MTQPVPHFGTVKRLSLEPLCSPKEAKEKFEGRYLDRGHVKYRLTESTHVVTSEGETKFLYLKRALPEALVARTWQDLQKLNFRPAKNSRRRALKGSMGGELLLGWIDFAQRSMGIAPMLTARLGISGRNSAIYGLCFGLSSTSITSTFLNMPRRKQRKQRLRESLPQIFYLGMVAMR